MRAWCAFVCWVAREMRLCSLAGVCRARSRGIGEEKEMLEESGRVQAFHEANLMLTYSL